MDSNINNGMSRLRRQFERADESANIMAAPRAWAECHDYNTASTWAEGRLQTVAQLRDLAKMASDLADHAEALPAWEG